MSLTPEQELWAVALHAQRRHGENAPFYVAERIGALVSAGDVDGVNVWRAIAVLLERLRAGEHGSTQ
jgi:hypothetical protein